MKIITWDPEKNERLKRDRHVSFEDVLFRIEAGAILDIFDHPNQERYRGQKIYALSIEEYVYLGPLCRIGGRDFS